MIFSTSKVNSENKLILASLALLFFFGVSFDSNAQVIIPATWTHSSSKESVAVGDKIELIFKAKIDPDWYLYSSDFDPECGPLVTTFTFDPDGSYSLEGDLKAIDPIDKFDDVFQCNVRIFKKKGEFRQTIVVRSLPLKITGSYEYQVCSDVSGQCIPFDEDFEFSEFENADLGNNAPDESIDKTGSGKAPSITAKPSVDTTKLQSQNIPAGGQTMLSEDSVNSAPDYTQIEGPVIDESLFKDGGEIAQKPSLWGFMILAFLAGLTALLTPCVFPMIPMTVSFFTHKGHTGKALIYGLSIVLIYTIIGSALAPLMGPETANALSTGWLPNIIFFTVFILFALSFFGLFEITLPGSFVNHMDRKSDRRGITGVFFMALTLVLVSFSCTGPIVGSLLVGSAGGQFLKPILGMFSFSLAFAIPFTLFAFFPGWLNKLPKSGGWLNSVKVVLGFIELALAFKFLSIADQAYHWGILDRDINIAIWVVIFTMLGLYLLGLIRLPHDSKLDHISVPRLLLGMCTFVFVIYLIPGLWGAPLKALAGYLPPVETNDFNLLKEEQEPIDYRVCEVPDYASFLSLPHGLAGYFDYSQAVKCARAQNKPLFIDFTGHGCTNCREMEAVVWSDPRVLKILKEDYVIVALYVDDKTELPEEQWYTSTYDNKVKKTIGKQNADLQIRRLNNNAQPFYILLGKDEKVLERPVGYDKDPDDFIRFLEMGKERFASRFKK